MAQINSVLGPISPNDLGFTLMHKHVIPELQRMGVSPATIETLLVENPRRFFGGK